MNDLKKPCQGNGCQQWTTLSCARCMRPLCRLDGAINLATMIHADGSACVPTPEGAAVGSMSDPFEFRVKRTTDEHDNPADLWQVNLPHQCDRWKITGDDYTGVTHDEAVAALGRFIDEALYALAELVQRRELHAEDE